MLLANLMMIKNWHEARLLNKLINGKSCTELDYEHLLYILMDKLDSKNPVEIAKFDSIIMDYEEGKDPD